MLEKLKKNVFGFCENDVHVPNNITIVIDHINDNYDISSLMFPPLIR
jgi:hypothetical protein